MLRPYRKNLTMMGLVYLEDGEQPIIVKNISVSGILAQLDGKADENDIKRSGESK
jgi:hypothetical protein